MPAKKRDMESKSSSTISQERSSDNKDHFSHALEYIEQFLTEDVEETLSDRAHVNPSALNEMENSFLQVLSNNQHISSPTRQRSVPFLVQNQPAGKLPTNCHQYISSKSSGSIDAVSISGINGGGTNSSPEESESILLQFQRGIEEAQRFLPSKNLLDLDSNNGNLHGKMEPPKLQHEGKYYTSNALMKVTKTNHQEVTREGIERQTQTLETHVEGVDELSHLFETLYLGPGAEHKLPYECMKEIISTSRGAGSTPYRSSLSASEEMAGLHLRALLLDCAQAIQNNNTSVADKLLQIIRKQSTTFGDGSKRLAHYFADALHSRLAGTGSLQYHALDTKLLSSAVDVSKAHQSFTAICPFRVVTFYFANEHISNIANKGTALHIIYFGINNGFECSRIIHHLSARSGGPTPKIRITAIDDAQASKGIKKAGHLLANYCKLYNVQLEYNGIAQKWEETICIKDLNIEKDEAIVVMNMLRFDTLLDEVVGENNPRSIVLSLVSKISPDIFVNFVKNGSYNTPLFHLRFRETLCHYSAWFDMLDTNMSREDSHRLLYERHIFGRELSNIIACEGADRVERALSCKQWEVQMEMAGFMPMLPERELVGRVKSIVKPNYHKEFLIKEDGPWILQGWKGRILCGIGCWVPTPTQLKWSPREDGGSKCAY